MLFWVNMFYTMFTWRGSINVTALRWLNPYWNSLSHGSWYDSSGANTLKFILLHIKVKVPDLSSLALSDRKYSWCLNKITQDPCSHHYLPANGQKCKDGATIKAVTFLLFESFDVTTWKFIYQLLASTVILQSLQVMWQHQLWWFSWNKGCHS